MTVAISATGTKLIGGSSVSSINYTGITVITGDSGLIVSLATGVSASSTAWSATWDSGGTNQAMTVLRSDTQGTNNLVIVVFGLRNPTPGNKTLALSWTGAGFPTVEAISVTGSDTTSDANAFPTANRTGNNSTAVTSFSLAITSATGNMVFNAWACSSFTASSPNQTIIYTDTTSSGADSGSQRAAGAASVTCSANNGASTTNWAFSGIDIAAGTVAATPAPVLGPGGFAFFRARQFSSQGRRQIYG